MNGETKAKNVQLLINNFTRGSENRMQSTQYNNISQGSQYIAKNECEE